MKLVEQPEGSSLCGQACIAMVTGSSLERAVFVVGHKNGTYTSDLIKAIRVLGCDCADRLRRISKQRPVLPKRCIVSIVKWVGEGPTRRQRKGHWILSWDGVIYDPGGVWPESYDKNGWTITSYLEIL